MERRNDLGRGRLRREVRTFEAMLALFCRERHGAGRGALCAACDELGAYARERLARCPYGAAKPACNLCPIHCYRPEMRERVREMMRHAGPRMLVHRPVLALFHLLLDARRPAPPLPARGERRGGGGLASDS
ncbi:MAG: nitrous oxide-stimulated promoter family protein [Thermoanaerobaculia bacterium]|nr:nitrous oxide-stimulated promoter family protein [Thermoanaerobaculia bacterium]